MEHKNTYVISYKERGNNYDVTWKASGANEAVRTFWESFGVADRRHVSSVRIYELINIEIDTAIPAAQEQEAMK